jgi:hypothetical protein
MRRREAFSADRGRLVQYAPNRIAPLEAPRLFSLVLCSLGPLAFGQIRLQPPELKAAMLGLGGGA